MARVDIIGQIGQVDEIKGVELVDVVNQIESVSPFTELEVFVESFGGNVQTSDEIYNYLNSFKAEGVKINTIAGEYVASAGVKLFLLGDKRDDSNCDFFMIHNPWGKFEGDSNVMEQVAKELKAIETDMANFYASITGSNVESISALMKIESVLTKEQTYSLGFSTTKSKESDKQVSNKAVAYFNLNTENMSEKKDDNSTKNQLNEVLAEFKETISGIKKLFTKDEVVAITFQTADGIDITFPDLENGEEPKVGDRVQFADGGSTTREFTLPNGFVYNVVDGVIESIVEVETEESEEMVALKSEITALKSELEEKETTIISLTNEKTDLKEKVEKKISEIQANFEGKFKIELEKEEVKKENNNNKPKLRLKQGYGVNNK